MAFPEDNFSPSYRIQVVVALFESDPAVTHCGLTDRDRVVVVVNSSIWGLDQEFQPPLVYFVDIGDIRFGPPLLVVRSSDFDGKREKGQKIRRGR